MKPVRRAALIVLACLALFVWVAWSSQGRSGPPADAEPNPAASPKTGGHGIEARDETGTSAAAGRVDVQNGDPAPSSTESAESSLDPDREVPLRDLPAMTRFNIRNRVLANINSALSTDGLPTLDPEQLRISMASAEELFARYQAIWRDVGMYDRAISERVDGLLASAGPGTNVIDTSGWDEVTKDRIIDEISHEVGREPGELIGGAQSIVRWRQEGPVHIRYGVFEPGVDDQLDSLWARQDEHLDTVVPRSLQGLAVFFSEGREESRR